MRSLLLALALVLSTSAPAAASRGLRVQTTTKSKEARAHDQGARLARGLGVPNGLRRGERSTRLVRGTRAQVLRYMKGVIRGGDTPSFEILPTAKGKASMRLVSKPAPGAWDMAAIPEYQVSNLGRGGVLHTDAFLPVSGHPSSEYGEAYAPEKLAPKTSFRITISHADGTRTEIPEIAAKGIVTEVGLALPLKPGANRIYFHPMPSAGPSQFIPGRTKVLHWDGR